MKQRFYNWIYRTLRKFGIKSTEVVNLTDAFNEAVKISGGKKYVTVRAEIVKYGSLDGTVKTEFTVYDEIVGHHSYSTIDKALSMYADAKKQPKYNSEQQIEI